MISFCICGLVYYLCIIHHAKEYLVWQDILSEFHEMKTIFSLLVSYRGAHHLFDVFQITITRSTAFLCKPDSSFHVKHLLVSFQSEKPPETNGDSDKDLSEASIYFSFTALAHVYDSMQYPHLQCNATISTC